MDRLHDVRNISVSGTRILMTVDGKQYEVELAQHSKSLAEATQTQRDNFVVSPAGYGIHWPDVDEDLSIDGLIGVVHRCPVNGATAK